MLALCQRLLLTGCWLLLAFASPAQTIDLESATRYWQLTDALRRNEPLTDQAWHDFLALPGNKMYVDAVYNDEQLARYRRAIEVVYMPRYDSLRQANIRDKVWYYVLVNDYKEHESEDRRYVAAMQTNPDYLRRIYTLAYEALPARNHTKAANLHLYYVLLGNAVTSQQGGLVFSLRSVRDGNAIKPGILEAHEMQHQLRVTRTYGPIAPADNDLLWLFYSALNEGTADLIDKAPRLASATDSAEIRAWLLVPAPAVVQRLDSAIRWQAAGGPAAPPRFYQQLTNGTNGHLPGFYMVRTIEQAGYRHQLLYCADDPLAFALLYQKAAKKSKSATRFSPEAEQYLKQLARRYAPPPNAGGAGYQTSQRRPKLMSATPQPN